MLETAEVLRFLIAALEVHRVDYAIGGSFASSAWGHPRQTNDLDIMVLIDLDRAAEFVTSVESQFFVDVREIISTLDSEDEYRSFQMLHQSSFFKVDAFVPMVDEYVASEMERAVRVELVAGVSARCLAAENVIVRKLRWFELGNRVSDRQWNDIVQVLEVQKGQLDEPYLDRWAEHFDVRELLDQARSQTID